MRLVLVVLLQALMISHANAKFEAYTVHRAIDASGIMLSKAPTIFLGHGCSGIVKSQTSDYVNDFTRAGYNVVVIDSLTPRGIKSACKNLTPNFKPRDRMVEYFEVLETVSKEPWHSGKAGYVGFSHGGSLGLNLAGEGRGFEVVVSYYPNCGKSVVPNRKLKLNTLVHVGTADYWTPLKNCEDIEGITQKIVHEGATHAFDIKNSRREFMGEILEYNESADRTARAATKGFLEKFLR